MNDTPSNAEAPDNLDRLFSEFFKAQLKHPWPKAPNTGAATFTSEPSEQAASRATETPGNTPAPARGRDNTARARFTLAASVVIVLGATWFLSSGFEPGERPNGVPQTNGPKMIGSGEANDKGVLPQLQKNKLNSDAPKFDIGKIE